MIQDLHSHTYYSFCGNDSPEEVIEAAIEANIEMLGINDHNYGIGLGTQQMFKATAGQVIGAYHSNMLRRYYEHISLLKEKYADKIKLLCGIEIATATQNPHCLLPEGEDVSFFDYSLIEHLNPDTTKTVTNGDLFGYAERLGTKTVGIAHTDMFAFINGINQEPYRYFKKMADNNIFWELNVNYDSIHGYKEHAYVKEFFENEIQQQIIRESGVRLAVGFDGHLLSDYLPQRVVDFCDKVTKLGIKLAFEE